MSLVLLLTCLTVYMVVRMKSWKILSVCDLQWHDLATESRKNQTVSSEILVRHLPTYELILDVFLFKVVVTRILYTFMQVLCSYITV
jgi:hypothetical protein